MKRRDLVRLLGTAVGGVSLATCSDDTPSGPGYGPAPLPNGFRFFKLFDGQTALPGGATFRHFLLDAAIDDQNDIYFSCIDANDKRGLYALHLNYGSGTPSVVSSRKVVHVGDVLTGGRTVLGIDRYDVNAAGGIAVVLTFAHPSAADGGPGTTKEVWFDLAKTGLTRGLYEGFITSDGHELSGLFGDIDIHDGHDAMLVAWYMHKDPQAGQPRPAGAPDDDVPRQGLWVLPNSDPAHMWLELHHEQLESAGGGLATIGLIDMHDDLSYVIQAHPSGSVAAAPAPGGGELSAAAAPGPFLITGRQGSRGRGLRALTRAAASTAPVLSLLGGGGVGDAHLGPRMGPHGLTAYVLHNTDDAMTLYYQGLEIIRTGGRSPRGSTVGAIMPPVFGTNGEIYYVLATRDGHELCTANGDEQRALLGHGDRLANDDRPVNSIMVGHTTDAVDGAGRIALATVFEDHSAAVTVGIPT